MTQKQLFTYFKVNDTVSIKFQLDCGTTCNILILKLQKMKLKVFNRFHKYYLLMLLDQSTGTHSSQLTDPLQQLAASIKNVKSLLAFSALILDKLFMYGEELGHLDQSSKLDHLLVIRHELSSKIQNVVYLNPFG